MKYHDQRNLGREGLFCLCFHITVRTGTQTGQGPGGRGHGGVSKNISEMLDSGLAPVEDIPTLSARPGPDYV